MRVTAKVQAIERLRASFATALLLIASIIIQPSAVSAEEPIIDKDAPILTGSVNGGDVRNITTFTLAVDDKNPAESTIEILKDGKSLDPRVMQSGSGNAAVSLRWDSRQVSDGSYSVRYWASDTFGNNREEVDGIHVVNDTPLLTLTATADQRTIGGSVSRNDVTFRMKIDGQLSDIVPVIATNPDDDGAYIWTAAMPDSVSSTKHDFEVVAIMKSTNVESIAVTKTIDLTPVLQVAPPTNDSTPLPVVLPTLDMADEVGQFIAPALPATQTQLFGTPTSDLTNDPAEDTTSLAPGVQSPVTKSVKSSALAERSGDATALKATPKGWVVYGLEWYWWLLAVVVSGVLVVSVAKNFRERESFSSFIRAESL